MHARQSRWLRRVDVAHAAAGEHGLPQAAQRRYQACWICIRDWGETLAVPDGAMAALSSPGGRRNPSGHAIVFMIRPMRSRQSSVSSRVAYFNLEATENRSFGRVDRVRTPPIVPESYF